MIVGQFCSFGLGGADKASFYLIKGLMELGIEIKIFYNEWSFPKPSPQLDNDVLLLSRYEQYKNLGLPMFEITDVNELTKHNIDILNTHRGGDDFWLIPGLESAKCNFKIVETNFHGNTLTRADLRIFPSNELVTTHPNIQTNFKVIPNPIMPVLSDGNLKHELNLTNKFVFGRIGRPSNDIYSNTCLKAYKLLENDTTHFLYVAPCNVAKTDATLIGINNITFIDQILDEIYISKIYNTFDVLCHSNKVGETFGNTVAEAMIHGVPVVSHLGCAWPQAQKELLCDYSSKYVCENNVSIYSNLMHTLHIDNNEYAKYSNYVRQRARTYYNYKSVAEEYIKMYKEVLS